MKVIKYLVLPVFILMGIRMSGQTVKDTLFFSNGSKIIGEIKGIKLGVITFDPDDANDITVQLQKLRSIAALSKIFRIETIEHGIYFGKMLPCDTPGYTNIITDKDSTCIYVEEISLLYPFRKSFIRRFTGNFSLGFNFTRSSDQGQLNFSGQLTYRSKKEEIVLSSSQIYSITDTSFSRDREDIGLKNNLYFNTTWFATVLLRYQRNLELGLLRRYQEGFGGGNKFITSKHVYAYTLTGIVINQEKNTDEESSGTLTEAFTQLTFNFFRFTKPDLSFNITEGFYYGIAQDGRIRNDAQVDIDWEIVKDLTLTLSAYINFDSQPPSTESKKLDYGVVFGVGFKF